jgi:hypothetical protein
MKRLVRLLERVKDAEACYRDNIPENLRGSSVYDSADESVSVMEEALEILASAYSTIIGKLDFRLGYLH